MSTGAGRRRPRLREGLLVLRRGPGELQIGHGPRALLLHGGDETLAGLLSSLDGTRDALELSRAHPEMATALVLLGEHGLLVEPVPEPAGPVLLVGAGELGRACGLRLAEAGVPLLLCDPGPPRPGLYDDPPRPTAALALRQLLDRRHGELGRRRPVLGVLNHWSATPSQPPALAVLATDRPETDRGMTELLLRRDLPHLLVRPLDGGAQLGPLVLPGQSCCTRCTDLYRARHDPGWPRLLTQLLDVPGRVHPMAARWASLTLIPSVLALLAGREPELLGQTVELDVESWQVWRRRWPTHPDCGCQLSHLLEETMPPDG